MSKSTFVSILLRGARVAQHCNTVVELTPSDLVSILLRGARVAQQDIMENNNITNVTEFQSSCEARGLRNDHYEHTYDNRKEEVSILLRGARVAQQYYWKVNGISGAGFNPLARRAGCATRRKEPHHGNLTAVSILLRGARVAQPKNPQPWFTATPSPFQSSCEARGLRNRATLRNAIRPKHGFNPLARRAGCATG